MASKILVIDDSRFVRGRIKEMLSADKFEILEAEDGLEGLNMIRQEHPKLILLDFRLPKVSGWEVFQEVKSDQKLKEIPLVLMSERKENFTEKISEPFEDFAFIEKPFNQKDLMDAMTSAMSKYTQAPVEKPPEADPVPDRNDEIDDIEKQIANMHDEMKIFKQQLKQQEDEMNAFKKELNQIVKFIQQKLK